MDLLEKVKLNDGTELTLIPMGIRKQEKSFTLSILTDLSYTELEELILNEDNISKIQCLSPINEVLGTYTDCISLNSLSKIRGGYMDGEEVKDVYVIELSTDANLAALRAVQKDNQELKEEVSMLTECILEMSKLLYV